MVKKEIKRRENADEKENHIMNAASSEFSQAGYDGARVDSIARKAGVNKQLLYYYFGSKDALFQKLIEREYQEIRRQEAEVPLDEYPADIAVLKLVEFTWDYYLNRPEFISLLVSENQMKARHLKESATIDHTNRSWINISCCLIERGVREGTIKQGIDPMQLNINIASLSFFYFMNNSTLSVSYKVNMMGETLLSERLRIIKDVIHAWIRPEK